MLVILPTKQDLASAAENTVQLWLSIYEWVLDAANSKDQPKTLLNMINVVVGSKAKLLPARMRMEGLVDRHVQAQQAQAQQAQAQQAQAQRAQAQQMDAKRREFTETSQAEDDKRESLHKAALGPYNMALKMLGQEGIASITKGGRPFKDRPEDLAKLRAAALTAADTLAADPRWCGSRSDAAAALCEFWEDADLYIGAPVEWRL
ncbi:hypothetical protein QBC39DRAFT_366332 [Podospora conica]|nr:hypothetical protein QBC39DRAFT_366332 [Schizothecium conicum]